MNARAPANVPTPLSRARRQLDQWRRRQSGRKRLPRELWSTAVALAREHGTNKTARTLGLKHESIQKHLAGVAPEAPDLGRTKPPNFLELPPRGLTTSSSECLIEWEERHGAKIRMHVKGWGRPT